MKLRAWNYIEKVRVLAEAIVSWYSFWSLWILRDNFVIQLVFLSFGYQILLVSCNHVYKIYYMPSLMHNKNNLHCIPATLPPCFWFQLAPYLMACRIGKNYSSQFTKPLVQLKIDRVVIYFLLSCIIWIHKLKTCRQFQLSSPRHLYLPLSPPLQHAKDAGDIQFQGYLISLQVT